MKVLQETAESRLLNTLFIVEATSFEVQCLWADHASDSQLRRFAPRHWEQVNPGWSITVGQLNSRLICISTSWARIDGQLVMFWEATSQLVDMLLVEKWLAENFKGKWGGGRDATTNAQNFHHCLHAIDDQL